MDGWERSFVHNMVRARLRLAMSQTELARRVQQRGISCHQQTIARIENGTRSVRLNEAQEMTVILFGGDWDLAIAPVGAKALEAALREDVDRSADDRSELKLRLFAWADNGSSDREAVEYDLLRYLDAVEEEREDANEGLVRRAREEIAAWLNFEARAGEEFDVVHPEAT